VTTIVPKVVGRTADAVSVKRSGQKAWDEICFLEEVRKLSGDEAVRVCNLLFRKAEALGCRLWWGKGAKRPNAGPVFDTANTWHPFFCICPYNKNTFIEMQCNNFRSPFGSTEQRVELKFKLEKIPGISIPEDKLYSKPNFTWDVLKTDGALHRFFDIFEWYIDILKYG
jgi:hypothetical protein